MILLVIMDRFTKLVRTVPLRVVTAAEGTKQVVNNWVFSCAPLIDDRTDRRQRTSVHF